MEFSNIEILLLVTLLDSISTGLVIPLLGHHLLMQGGHQITIGYLISFTFIAHAFSKDFLLQFEHGKKMGLVMSLSFSFFSLLVLICSPIYHLSMACGIFHALSDRVCDYSKEYVADQSIKGRKTKIFALFDLMSVMGLVIGPVLAGYVLSFQNNVVHNATCAAVVTYLNLVLLQMIDNDPPNRDIPRENPEAIAKAIVQLRSLIELDYLEFWDSIILKIAYVASFTIFFSEFALLINHNFCVHPTIIGYTVAYQHLLLFLCNCLAPFIRRSVLKDDRAQQIFEYTLLACSSILLSIYFAPSYRMYLLIIVPLFLTHAVVDNIWQPLDVDVEGEVQDANVAIRNVVAVATPIFFGHFIDVKGTDAFKFFAVLPPALCVYYLKQNFFNSNVKFIALKISEGAMALKKRREADKKKKRRKKEDSDEEESDEGKEKAKGVEDDAEMNEAEIKIDEGDVQAFGQDQETKNQNEEDKAESGDEKATEADKEKEDEASVHETDQEEKEAAEANSSPEPEEPTSKQEQEAAPEPEAVPKPETEQEARKQEQEAAPEAEAVPKPETEQEAQKQEQEAAPEPEAVPKPETEQEAQEG